MGLFGGKDDTKAKIEELKAKMQQGQQQPQGWQQPPQQPWQQPQPQYQPPQQTWQPPREQRERDHAPEPAHEMREPEPSYESFGEGMEGGIILDLGDGMSLNLPVKQHMKLDEFLRIADRVRELKKIEHPQRY